MQNYLTNLPSTHHCHSCDLQFWVRISNRAKVQHPEETHLAWALPYSSCSPLAADCETSVEGSKQYHPCHWCSESTVSSHLPFFVFLKTAMYLFYRPKIDGSYKHQWPLSCKCTLKLITLGNFVFFRQTVPKPIALEPCFGNKAAVLSVFVRLPRGLGGIPPPGQSGE